MRLVAFCEARADFQLTSALIDRVLRDHAGWISDALDADPEGIRTWIGDGRGHDFFDLHKVHSYALEMMPRLPQGHFDGRPGASGALMARTAFSMVRAMNRRPNASPIDGVVLVWDMDDQATDRKQGLDQARAEAQRLMPFQVILGRPDRMREAWVLAGFDPQSEEEQARFDAERQQLGFQPNLEAHRLTAGDEQAKRSAKRVLAVLTADDRAREERCWTEAALTTLRARGLESGLVELLDAIEQDLVPLCTGRARR